MKMKDLTSEKYKYKLRTVECIEILKEQNEKRLKEVGKNCSECLYSECSNSLNEVCIEEQCLNQLISVYDELVSLCLKNNLLDENSRVVKVYKQ
jgi:hypothetical protein